MKCFITGDLHGDYNGELRYLQTKKWTEQKNLTKEDILFQLGDFGFYYYYPEVLDKYKKERRQIEQLSMKKFTFFIIPGNHENYDLIESLPVIEKWGGKVYVDKTKYGSIYIAQRGEIYQINGKKIFTFGGAQSSYLDEAISKKDVGTIKKIKKRRYGSFLRYEHKKIKISKVNYWEREIANEEEMNYAIKNLSKHNFEVDYILTHTCPKQFIKEFIYQKENVDKENFETKNNCPVATFLDKIYEQTSFKEWYFGHLHVNHTKETPKGKLICHYKDYPKKLIC